MEKPTVFISYSHADSQFVDQLAKKLKASGVDVWIDKWMIKVGDSITGKINEGIGASDFLIVVLSHASVNSKWVREELNAATIRNIEEEKHAFILPVLLEDCEIPTLLRDKRYANFADNAEQAFQELLEVVQLEDFFEQPQTEFSRLYKILDRFDGVKQVEETYGALANLLRHYGTETKLASFKLLFSIPPDTKPEEVTWLAKKIGLYAGFSLIVFDQDLRKTMEVWDEVEHLYDEHYSSISAIVGSYHSLRPLIVAGVIGIVPRCIAYYFQDWDHDEPVLRQAVELSPRSTEDFIQGCLRVEDAWCAPKRPDHVLIKIIRVPYWPDMTMSEIMELRESEVDMLTGFRRDMERLLREGDTVHSESGLAEILKRIDHRVKTLCETLRGPGVLKRETERSLVQMPVGLILHLASPKSRSKLLTASAEVTELFTLGDYTRNIQRRLFGMDACQFWLLLRCARINARNG